MWEQQRRLGVPQQPRPGADQEGELGDSVREKPWAHSVITVRAGTPEGTTAPPLSPSRACLHPLPLCQVATFSLRPLLSRRPRFSLPACSHSLCPPSTKAFSRKSMGQIPSQEALIGCFLQLIAFLERTETKARAIVLLWSHYLHTYM